MTKAEKALRERSEMERRLRAIAAAAYNYRVTSRDWIHHPSDMLKATILDLDYELKQVDEYLEKLEAALDE